MKPKDTIDFHIRWAWLRIAKMYNQQAAEHGLTQASAFVLLNIDPIIGSPSTHLGPMMGMEPTSLSRTLKTMEEKGWVFRATDENDKRVTRILLTDEGKRLRDLSRTSVINFNNKLFEAIPPKKVEVFKEVIQIIDYHTLK